MKCRATSFTPCGTKTRSAARKLAKSAHDGHQQHLNRECDTIGNEDRDEILLDIERAGSAHTAVIMIAYILHEKALRPALLPRLHFRGSQSTRTKP